MAPDLKFVAYNGPPSGRKKQTKPPDPTSTSIANNRDQEANSPVQTFLALQGGESQFHIAASQLPESQEPQVHFSQFKYGGSGPASPDDLPSIAELLRGLKATRTSSLDGEQTTATDNNPHSNDEDESGHSPVIIEDSVNRDDDSDGDGDGDEIPRVSSRHSHVTADSHDLTAVTAITQSSQRSETHVTTPGTTASSPSITTAKTPPPQSDPNDSGCPTGSAENAGLVEDDDEDLSDVDSRFVRHRHHVTAKRGAGYPVQPAKRHRSHDTSGSGRNVHIEDGERPRNAKGHKPSPTKSYLTSAGGQHPERKYGLRRLPSRRQNSAARSLVSPRRTLPQRGSGPISRLKDTPRADRIAIRSSCSGDSPLSSPVSFPVVRKATSDCCHACGISVQSLLGRISTALSYIPSDFELFASIHRGILSQSDKVALMSLLCLQGIRGDIVACSIKANTPTSRTDSEDLRPKHDGYAVDATDGHLSCDGMRDGDSSSGSTEHDSSDDDIDLKSIGGISGEGNSHSRGKGRLWTELEENRLRVYVKEKKQWGWIASQLGRTEGAVRVHWSLMGRK